MLIAEGLTKSYRRQVAVEGVDLQIAPGRVVGLVGNNGAGKTTTIKMVVGLLEPTRGTAKLDGRRTLDAPTRQRLGYLPEESPLYEDIGAMAYLTFFGSLYGIHRTDARRRAEDLLKRFDLQPQHWDRPIGQLSKGMRRKIAIARCLLHEPTVVVLDEPTSGLDPQTTAELNALIRELRAQGKAVLLSAHNLQQVEELCDEIVIMHKGRIVTRGTLAELRGRYGTLRYRVSATTEFPGSVPEGTVHAAWFDALPAVERAMEAVRKANGIVLEVESVPPRLDEILRRVAEG